jgi:hypothetical protein
MYQRFRRMAKVEWPDVCAELIKIRAAWRA